MKVSELRNALANIDGEWDVSIEDANGSHISIREVSAIKPLVSLEVSQEFPDAWYRDGLEVHWIKGKSVITKDIEETEELEVVSEDFFGDSKAYNFCLKFYDGYAKGEGLTMEYPKLAELTDEMIDAIDEYTGGQVTDSGYVCQRDVCLLYGEVVSFSGIMDTTNGHNADLVRKINALWVKRKREFEPILKALYERDIEEITDHDAFLYDQWKAWPEYNDGCETNDWSNYNTRALEDLKDHWYYHAENYLQHIADDGDLETIIDFLR